MVQNVYSSMIGGKEIIDIVKAAFAHADINNKGVLSKLQTK